jgi:MraZ protein
MLRVRCQASGSLDDKGRLALPSPLRRALSDHGVEMLVLTFFKGAVVGWLEADFEAKVEAPLAGADAFKEDVRNFTHALVSQASNVEIDPQGRIRLPTTLRELARLDKEVVIFSVLDRVEIWDRATWDKRFQEALVQARDGLPGVSP